MNLLETLSRKKDKLMAAGNRWWQQVVVWDSDVQWWEVVVDDGHH